MNEKRLYKDIPWTTDARTTVIIGFLLRMVMLIVIVYMLDGIWDMYYLEDDKMYEEVAKKYLENSRGLIDGDLLFELTRGWSAPFWVYVLCISGKLMGTMYASRFINVILSTLCIVATYNLTYEISGNQKVSLTAARLFAFLPFPILISCFPFKDLFIMYGVMYTFRLFVRVQNDRKLSIGQVILCVILLICMFYTRGAVTELMLFFLLAYYILKLYRKKSYLAILALVAITAAVVVVFRNQLFAAFDNKIEEYSNYGAEDASGLNAIRVTSLLDIYKLPLAYAFSMLQPVRLELFTISSSTRPWFTVITYANLTMFPVAMGAWLYMFVKKHNLFFWLSSFIMFAAVIMLSLGVSRHYLFLLPVHMINYSLYLDDTQKNFKNRRTLVILGTFALLAMVFCYSLVKLL